MRGKKTDTKKRVDIAISKLNDPDKSTRDIADETNTSKSSVARIINEELGQIGTNEKSQELYAYNLEIIKEGARKIAKAMKDLNPENIRDTKEYQEIVEKAFKQNLLIEGKATDKIDITVDISKMTPQQINEYINSKLS